MSETLEQLEQRIRVAVSSKPVDHSIGELLREAKSLCGHGQFLAWAMALTGKSRKTIAQWMRVTNATKVTNNEVTNAAEVTNATKVTNQAPDVTHEAEVPSNLDDDWSDLPDTLDADRDAHALIRLTPHLRQSHRDRGLIPGDVLRVQMLGSLAINHELGLVLSPLEYDRFDWTVYLDTEDSAASQLRRNVSLATELDQQADAVLSRLGYEPDEDDEDYLPIKLNGLSPYHLRMVRLTSELRQEHVDYGLQPGDVVRAVIIRGVAIAADFGGRVLLPVEHEWISYFTLDDERQAEIDALVHATRSRLSADEPAAEPEIEQAEQEPAEPKNSATSGKNERTDEIKERIRPDGQLSFL